MILAGFLIWNAATADALTPRDCQVLQKRAFQVPGKPEKFQAIVHVALVDELSAERQIYKYRNPSDWEVELLEVQRYISRYQKGSIVKCYQFDDGELQLENTEYTSVWVYVIIVLALLFASLCCCVWLTSAVFACCSADIELDD